MIPQHITILNLTMPNIYKLLILVSISLLVSCSNKIVFNENITSSTNILIISEYPDTFYIDVIGTTIFANGKKEFGKFGIDPNKTTWLCTKFLFHNSDTAISYT